MVSRGIFGFIPAGLGSSRMAFLEGCGCYWSFESQSFLFHWFSSLPFHFWFYKSLHLLLFPFFSLLLVSPRLLDREWFRLSVETFPVLWWCAFVHSCVSCIPQILIHAVFSLIQFDVFFFLLSLSYTPWLFTSVLFQVWCSVSKYSGIFYPNFSLLRHILATGHSQHI